MEAGDKENTSSNANSGVPTDTNAMSESNTPTKEGEDSMTQEQAATTTEPAAPDENDTGGISELPVVPSVYVEVAQESSPPVVSTTPARKTDDKAGRKLVGKKVETAFGIGVVVDYRSKDSVYEIQLENNNSSPTKKSNKKNLTTLYSVQVPKVCKPSQADVAKQLNVAYEALETMRRLNLDVQCYEAGIPSADVDYEMCTACLLANKGATKSHFPRLQRFVDTAHQAGNDIDQQVKEQLPGLHKLFNPTPKKKDPPPSSTNTGYYSNRKKSFWQSSSLLPESASASFSSLKITGAANSAASGFRSLSKSVFGETKVKEEGSSADPNVILHNRITNTKMSSSITNNKKAPPKSDKPIALGGIQRMINNRKQANTSPCLICASPSCPSCSSSSFRKEGITLCLKCERLFELDFIVDCVSTSDARKRAERIEYMVDCYDRCMLLLQYSKQFGEQIATSLEDQKTKQDKIGLASSSVGVVSGILGIAAAASILTPAGPPLLIASLFFGGSATTVQSGTEALNYLSEPRKLADRIIALHGMSLSILRVTSTLRDAMMRDHIRTDVYEAESVPLSNQKIKESYEKNKTKMVMGSNTVRSLTGLARIEAGVGTAAGTAAAAGAAGEAGAMGAAATAASTAGAAGARVSTTVSRAGTAAARTVRFARFAGGALSAAVLVMEANAIQSTVKSISQGSPCDKANKLRSCLKEIEAFPSTTELDQECQSYLSVLAQRPEPPIEVVAESDDQQVDGEIIEAPCQQVDEGERLCAPGAVILEETQEAANHPAAAAVPVPRAAGVLRPGALFQRMQTRREDRRVAREEVVAVAVEDDQLGESNFSLIM